MQPLQIALVGGVSRCVETVDWPAGYDIQHYEGARYGGSGGKRALVSSIMAKSVDGVVGLRWLSHHESEHVKAVCKANGVPFRQWPNGLSSLKRDLPRLFERGFDGGGTTLREVKAEFGRPDAFAPPPDSVREAAGEVDVVEDNNEEEAVQITEENWKEHFSSVLKKGMAEAGIKGCELAELLDLHKGSTSNYTRGKGVPLPFVYGKLLALFPALNDLPLPRFKIGHVVVSASEAASEVERGRTHCTPAPSKPVEMPKDEPEAREVAAEAPRLVVAANPITEAAAELSQAIVARDAARSVEEQTAAAHAKAEKDLFAANDRVEKARQRILDLAK